MTQTQFSNLVGLVNGLDATQPNTITVRSIVNILRGMLLSSEQCEPVIEVLHSTDKLADRLYAKPADTRTLQSLLKVLKAVLVLETSGLLSTDTAMGWVAAQPAGLN